MRYKYQLDNLNCAHCAGKIEAKIAETNGFEDVSFNFATKLLNFKSEKQNPVSEIQAICDSIVDQFIIDSAYYSAQLFFNGEVWNYWPSHSKPGFIQRL